MLPIQIYVVNNIIYRMSKIHEVVQSNEIFKESVEQLVMLNHDIQTDEGFLRICLEKHGSVEFRKRALATNLNFPIILNEDAGLVDGAHRLAKAYFLRHQKIRCKIISPKQLKMCRM